MIIPSYNRKDDLKALLPALVNQTLPKDQYGVLLVDDGPTDGTDEFVSTFQERDFIQFRFPKQDHRDEILKKSSFDVETNAAKEVISASEPREGSG